MELTIQTDTISPWKHKMKKLWTTGIFRRKETKYKLILPGASKAIALPSRAHGFTLGFWWGLCCASFYFSVLPHVLFAFILCLVYNNISVIYISGENRSIRKKPQTCRMSLSNFITKCCAEYTSL